MRAVPFSECWFSLPSQPPHVPVSTKCSLLTLPTPRLPGGGVGLVSSPSVPTEGPSAHVRWRPDD
ncbi:hypothetical protein E2C01_015872 [Portunus trituberculatus]|uniref:Uncharacterized protein n=1 Tax=Portunus trituberculatus TaxID=210409 RepID=A0A5B7DNR9_PORTR|nr:hypothetical protein [Portunus trituberculatus]